MLCAITADLDKSMGGVSPLGKVILKKDDIDQDQYLIWNSYINLIATSSYEELDDVQQVAHLCFWYDSEVQNGGHLQYFENQGTQRIMETLNALIQLNAYRQKEILSSAYKLYSSRVRAVIRTVQQFVSTALEGEYEKFDNQYYECNPRLIDLLNVYLENNFEKFIKVVE